MIEEIIKEINENKFIISLPLDTSSHYEEQVIEIEDLFKILDKYENQPDYKSAFKEIKLFIRNMHLSKIKDEDIHKIDDFIQELESKYNLGGE